LRVAGKVEPLFVDRVEELPQAIAANARAGDVVMCMGAGSIGGVPAKVVEWLQQQAQAGVANEQSVVSGVVSGVGGQV